jgi:hypothetical protein
MPPVDAACLVPEVGAVVSLIEHLVLGELVDSARSARSLCFVSAEPVGSGDGWTESRQRLHAQLAERSDLRSWAVMPAPRRLSSARMTPLVHRSAFSTRTMIRPLDWRL